MICTEGNVCKSILDFFALVELKGAYYYIRNFSMKEFFFKTKRLGICSVKHRPVGIFSPAFERLGNKVCNKGSLGILVRQKGKHRLTAFASVCYQSFFKAAMMVLFYNKTGRIQNACGRTVVALQLDYLCTRKFFREGKNIFYLGTTEFVDGLVVITNNTDVSAAALFYSRKTLQKPVLGNIRVLILVHHNHLKAVMNVICNFAIAFQNLNRQHNEVAEISITCGPKTLLIF